MFCPGALGLGSVDPVALATLWFRRVVASQYPVQTTCHSYICSEPSKNADRNCKEAMVFKYQSCAKVSGLTRPIGGVLVGSRDYAAGAAMFRNMVTWENFVAHSPTLMKEFVKSCDRFRDPKIPPIFPIPDNLGNQGIPYAASWAAATSSIGDFGIAVGILHAQGRSSKGEDPHSLIKILLIGVFQQMYLDYESSGIKNCSASYSPGPKNPAIATSHSPEFGKMCNTHIPTFLWAVWSWAIHQLREKGVSSLQNRSLIKAYTSYVSRGAMRAAEEIAGGSPSNVTATSEEGRAKVTLESLIASLVALDKTIKKADQGEKYVNHKLEPLVASIIQMQIGGSFERGVRAFTNLMAAIMDHPDMMKAVRGCIGAFTAVDDEWNVEFRVMPQEHTGQCIENERGNCNR